MSRVPRSFASANQRDVIKKNPVRGTLKWPQIGNASIYTGNFQNGDTLVLHPLHIFRLPFASDVRTFWPI